LFTSSLSRKVSIKREDLFEFDIQTIRTCGSIDPYPFDGNKKNSGFMFFLPAGIKKQGVAEKAAIIHAAGCVSPMGAWGGRGQKTRQGGEGEKAMNTV